MSQQSKHAFSGLRLEGPETGFVQNDAPDIELLLREQVCRIRKCGLCVGIVFATVTCVGAGCVRSFGTEVSSDDKHYFTAWGIAAIELTVGAAIAALIFIFLAILPFSAVVGFYGFREQLGRDNAQLAMNPVVSVTDVTFDNPDLSMYKFGGLRLLRLCGTFGKFVLNIFFIAATFSRLPHRDPEERLNEAKHYVSIAEVMCLIFCGPTALLLFLAGLLHRRMIGLQVQEAKRQDHKRATGFCARQSVMTLSFAAKMTAMNFITYADPMLMLTSAMRLASTFGGHLENKVAGAVVGIAAAMFGVLFSMLMGLLGMTALVVKINQVHFLTEETLSWQLIRQRPTDMAIFIAFAVAVAGLVSRDDMRLDGVLNTAVACEDKKFQERAKKNIQDLIAWSICKRFSWPKAFALIWTLDVDMYVEALFHKKDIESLATDVDH